MSSELIAPFYQGSDELVRMRQSLEAAEAKLEAVRKLHYKTFNKRAYRCHHDGHMWPCPTRRAIQAIGEGDESE